MATCAAPTFVAAACPRSEPNPSAVEDVEHGDALKGHGRDLADRGVNDLLAEARRIHRHRHSWRRCIEFLRMPTPDSRRPDRKRRKQLARSAGRRRASRRGAEASRASPAAIRDSIVFGTYLPLRDVCTRQLGLLTFKCRICVIAGLAASRTRALARSTLDCGAMRHFG